MNLNCKIKFENYLKENNLEDKNNILELFNQLSLEQLAEKLLTLDEDKIVNYATECVCEELLITSSYKIERTGMKLGLHRMEHILELFDHPEKDLRVIHVAGTNGKGSTCSYLKDVLKTKYRVGLYTSPGMLSFNDRIRVNDDFISYKEAYRLFKLVQETYDKNNPDPSDKLSFFEIITGFSMYAMIDPNGIIGTLFAPIITLFGGEYKVHIIHHYIAWGFLFFTIIHVYMAFREDVMEESGEVSAMVSGMKYYAHDPIDIEDLNGKRRRGERIDKPSGTTYRPSNPDDPREKELKDD